MLDSAVMSADYRGGKGPEREVLLHRCKGTMHLHIIIILGSEVVHLEHASTFGEAILRDDILRQSGKRTPKSVDRNLQFSIRYSNTCILP